MLCLERLHCGDGPLTDHMGLSAGIFGCLAPSLSSLQLGSPSASMFQIQSC